MRCKQENRDNQGSRQEPAGAQEGPTFGLFPDSTLGTAQNGENASRYGKKRLVQDAPLVTMLLLTGEPPDLTPGGLLDDEHRAGGGWVGLECKA